jgi:hypothetical protein
MFFRKLVLDSFKPLKRGSLEVILPGGERHLFGGLFKGLQAILRPDNLSLKSPTYDLFG